MGWNLVPEFLIFFYSLYLTAFDLILLLTCYPIIIIQTLNAFVSCCICLLRQLCNSSVWPQEAARVFQSRADQTHVIILTPQINCVLL